VAVGVVGVTVGQSILAIRRQHPVLGVVDAIAGRAHLRVCVLDQAAGGVIPHFVRRLAAVSVGRRDQAVIGAVDLEAGIWRARHVREVDQPVAEAVVAELLVEYSKPAAGVVGLFLDARHAVERIVGVNIRRQHPIGAIGLSEIFGFASRRGGGSERIARLQKESSYIHIELSERIGTIQEMISDYERGNLRPNGKMAVRFVLALEVTTNELLGLMGKRAARGKKPNAFPLL